MTTIALLGRRRNQGGVVALEFALLVPVVSLLVFVVILAGVHAVDQVAVQDAARGAARAAATSRSEAAAREVAAEALAGRSASLSILPPRRRAGDRFTVTVTWTRDVGPITWTVRGQAVAVTEPGV